MKNLVKISIAVGALACISLVVILVGDLWPRVTPPLSREAPAKASVIEPVASAKAALVGGLVNRYIDDARRDMGVRKCGDGPKDIDYLRFALERLGKDRDGTREARRVAEERRGAFERLGNAAGVQAMKLEHAAADERLASLDLAFDELNGRVDKIESVMTKPAPLAKAESRMGSCS